MTNIQEIIFNQSFFWLNNAKIIFIKIDLIYRFYIIYKFLAIMK